MVNAKRHKVHVPLRSKGAELQLPAFPRLHLGWRLISGAIFIFSLAVVITFSSLNTFKVSAINLEGAQRLNNDAINLQVGFINESIIKVKPGEVEAQILEAFPSLSRVRVSLGLPASVTIRVTERQPQVLWQQESQALWIDADGVMFPVRGEAEVLLTVVATNDPPAAPSPEKAEEEIDSGATNEELAPTSFEETAYPKTTPEFVQGIIALKDYLPEGSHVQYEPQFGLGWQDPDGWAVYFGSDISNIDLKLAEYQTILAALKANNLTPALISVEFLHAPYYRLEQ